MGFDEAAGSSSSINARAADRPREDKPLLAGNHPNTKLSSQSKTFANVFIAIVGAGVLGLPYSFMRTGWLSSLIMIFAVAALTYYCTMLLILTRKKLLIRTPKDNIASFGDLGFAVCGPIGRIAVDAMIFLSQAGFCAGYLIFINDTLANLFNSSSSSANIRPKLLLLDAVSISAKSVYVWACLPFQLALNSIASLTRLAPLSIFADVVDLGAMPVVLVEDFIVFMKQRPAVEAFGSFSTFFYSLGVAVFSFEGIGMAFPLESEMKDKSKFGRILGLSMLFIACMYGSFGLMGYLAFGANTRDIITANLGKGSLSALVQLGLCINLFFTFPLMMNPVYEVFERRFWDGSYCLWMRWLLVVGVSLVALFVPNFADFSSLVGSSTSCMLGFVLPALFHYLVFKAEMDWKAAFLDLTIVILGAFLAVSGRWYSLLEIFS